MPALRYTGVAAVLCLLPAAVAWADGPVDYTRQVKPILTRHCQECHNAAVQKGKLRLDTAAHLLKGGRNGLAVVPGQAAKSLLIDVLKEGTAYERMPYQRPPLKEAEVRLLAAWIDQGAKAPATEKGTAKHWAFVAPRRPALPAVKNRQWPRNAIDYFILAQLEKEGIAPSPEADRATLIRRLYLDLLGLPPSPADVDVFQKDARPDAYERLVDRVLASPHYGERWGRHWLDLARYADTNGFTIDSPREIWKYRDWVIDALNRDLPFDQFVIEQFAGDLLPQATLEQKIATGFHRNTLVNEEGGIDLEQFRDEAVADRVNTTGTVFLGLTLGCARCHDHKYDPIAQKEYYQLFAFLNNQADTKLNIATPELAEKRQVLTAKFEKLEEELDGQLKSYVSHLPEAERNQLKQELVTILSLGVAQRSSSQKRVLAKFFQGKTAELKKGFEDVTALEKQLPRFPTTLILQELSKPRPTYLHIQGDFTRKGDKVSPDVPAVLHSLPPTTGTGLNRLDLARWLVDPRNPLVGRVTMNRLWQGYFGKGLVETENDFGTQGAAPTHPELLDWLAVEFIAPSPEDRGSRIENRGSRIENRGRQQRTFRSSNLDPQSSILDPRARGWSLKHMHRLIVTSATYRQSAKTRPDLTKIDPYNKLLGRQNRLRLDAEIVRDEALAVSGRLSRKMGGPSVFPPQPPGVYAFTQVDREWKTSTGPDRHRRGIYTFLQRSLPYPALMVFDAPDGTSSCTRRVRSNTPLQALTLLNDEAFLELARGLAGRVLQETPSSTPERIRCMFRLCLVRDPSTWEAQRLERFVNQQLEEYRKSPKAAKGLLLPRVAKGKQTTPPVDLPPESEWPERAAWTALARALMNLDEFITRE